MAAIAVFVTLAAMTPAAAAADPLLPLAPAPPTLSGSDPASPSSASTPIVVGGADPGVSIQVFTSADCTDGPVGSGWAGLSGAWAVAVTLPAEGGYRLYATATDPLLGTASECSQNSLDYNYDATPPGPPLWSGSSPASPSREGSPQFSGTAEPGATVSLYTSPDCASQTWANSGAADRSSGDWAVAVTLTEEGSYPLSATATDAAGNQSACSEGPGYTYDRTPPDVPAWSDPAPPSGSDSPTLTGTAQPGSTVAVFTDSECPAGTPVQSATADRSGGWSIPVTVRHDSTTVFRATATDTAGNPSGCSPGFAYDSRSPASLSPPPLAPSTAPAMAPVRPDPAAVAWVGVGTGGSARSWKARYLRLSNEHTTRWAHVRRITSVRKSASDHAKTVARLRYWTEDGAPEVYETLRDTVDRRGVTWVEIRLPMRPNGTTGWVRRSALGGFHVVHTRFVVDRRRLTAVLYKGGRVIWRARVGVGKATTPTPGGRFWIRELLRSGSPGSLYGPWAFGTSDYSVLTDWPGGGVVGVHGTNEPQLIPGRPSHGCVRVRNGPISRLARLMPLGTPVLIH